MVPVVSSTVPHVGITGKRPQTGSSSSLKDSLGDFKQSPEAAALISSSQPIVEAFCKQGAADQRSSQGSAEVAILRAVLRRARGLRRLGHLPHAVP